MICYTHTNKLKCEKRKISNHLQCQYILTRIFKEYCHIHRTENICVIANI